MSAGALGSIGLVTLFITVLSLMGTIEQAFNRIWHVKAARKLTRKFSDYLSVILVGPVLVVAALTITATLQSNSFVQKMISLEAVRNRHLNAPQIRTLFDPLGSIHLPLCLHSKYPGEAYVRRDRRPGGGGALANRGLGIYCFVASSTRYYAIYSSFAILLLFLLWLHVGWGDRIARGPGGLRPSTHSLL